MIGTSAHSGVTGGSVGKNATLLLLAGLLAVAGVWAMTVGTSDLAASEVVDALVRFDGSREHTVVIYVRLPRVLAGILVGASFAVAGAIMQAATNNPLASPDLLGINAGAAFCVVMSIILFNTDSSAVHAWFAFAGATAAAVAVYTVASFGVGGATPLKLLLAGAVFSVFLTSLTTAVLIFDQGALDQIRLWAVGSLAGRPLSSSVAIAPYTILGILAALLFRRQITTLSLGAEIARSIGQNAVLWRAIAAGIVVILAGSAVALAGPIAFVGLVVPHIARMTMGVDYRWIIPFSGLFGALLVVSADAVARLLMPSQSLPVGVTMALIGAPFFIYLARSRADARA
ncbi:iron ABC transporter permease [Aquamicrobium sp. LC103]|uniref:FecCD family ABC transporter permease n=1 Tax=Aquamicrobium sp. LC103 TaxID=1120658 RepID=UPI001FEED9CE|nr:iron ABC transporter permease [Aquamicrobium sp. LC103]